MTLGEVVKKYRLERGLSQRELAKLAGRSPSFISLLEKGKYVFTSQITLDKLAHALRIKPQILYEAALTGAHKPIKEIRQPTSEELLREVNALMCIQVPIRGSVPAGIPAVKEELFEGYIAISKDELSTTRKDIYALRVCGESLEGDNIHDGDLLIIEPDIAILDSKIYVLRLGDEVVARHVFQKQDKLKLVASNGSYQVIEVTEAEILGRVVLAGRWQKF
jgi:repressor LexA